MSLSNWGASAEEIAATYVGDDLCPSAQVVATRAITIATSPVELFPWIRQMGFGKAGWYSYDLIDNLGKRSATAIHPEWQNVSTGDLVPGGPIAFTALLVDAPQTFILGMQGKGRFSRRINFTLAYILREQNSGTRLITRVQILLDFPGGALVAKYLLGPGDGIMLRKQMLTLRKRAEN